MRVIETQEIWINPVESAVSQLITKSTELEDKIQMLISGREKDVGPLSMILNGMIDAAVNGGTKNYIEAFLTPEYADEHPDMLDLIQQLKNALWEQNLTLRRGLDVFAERCGKNLQGLYDHLESQYAEGHEMIQEHL